MHEAKIQKPPGWIKGILITALILLIAVGLPVADSLDKQAKLEELQEYWRQPVTLMCENELDETMPPLPERITIIIPSRRCWTHWLSAPRGATGVWVDEWPSNLAVYWYYRDGSTYKQESASDQYAPVGRRVVGAKFFNTGSEPITIPIRFK